MLYGFTGGLIVDGPTWHHMTISADIQTRTVRKSGESLTGAGAGPRFSFPLKHGFTPYGEFLVGFARYNNSIYTYEPMGSTTDGQIQVNGGVAKKVSPRWDISADYSYSQYYALGGEYNPKSFSVGAIFHFVKR
jgi:opacity protein-like surface antigen